MWNTIINPENGKRTYTAKKKGVKILNNYLKHLGGSSVLSKNNKKLQYCNFNKIPNFSVNDTFEIRYIWTPGNRAELSKYFDMTHHFIRIKTKNEKNEECIYTLGLKSGKPNSKLPFSRELTAIRDNIPSSLQGPDFFISWCSNNYAKPSLYKTRLGCYCDKDEIEKTFFKKKWCYINDEIGYCLGDKKYKQYSWKEDDGEEEKLAGFWDWVDEEKPSEMNPERRRNSVCVPDDSEIINNKINFKGKAITEPQKLNERQIQFLKWFFKNSRQGEIRGNKKDWKEFPLPFKWTFTTYKTCKISSGENCQSFALDFKNNVEKVITKIEDGEKNGKYNKASFPNYKKIKTFETHPISLLSLSQSQKLKKRVAQTAGKKKKSKRKRIIHKRKSVKKGR